MPTQYTSTGCRLAHRPPATRPTDQRRMDEALRLYWAPTPSRPSKCFPETQKRVRYRGVQGACP
jgi:hypothetical protein